MKFPPVAEQLAVLQRGVVDLVDRDDLQRRLEQSRAQGVPLRIKFGIDPSSPDIHLGHTVPLRKLRDFQRLGHRVIVLWGTATAMVGGGASVGSSRYGKWSRSFCHSAYAKSAESTSSTAFAHKDVE